MFQGLTSSGFLVHNIKGWQHDIHCKQCSVTRIEYLQHARIIAKPTLAALVVWFNPFLTRVLLALTVRGFLAICLQLIHNIIIPATKREKDVYSWQNGFGCLTFFCIVRSNNVIWDHSLRGLKECESRDCHVTGLNSLKELV